MISPIQAFYNIANLVHFAQHRQINIGLPATLLKKKKKWGTFSV